MSDPQEPKPVVELSLDQARERISELEQELSRLEAGLRLTVQAPSAGGRTGDSGALTISNLEELVLMVNADRTIGYVNAPMALLLEMTDRTQVLGEPLEGWDCGAVGEGTLSALVASALSVGQSVVVERAVPGLPLERLPRSADARPAGDPILRFVATPMKGRVQVSVQDVTRLRWLESTFSRFVSPHVIEQMLTSLQEDFLEMKRCEITMLYVDLRGFTRLSQTLPLPTLQSMMHHYFDQMQGAVERHGGTVGQFVGDEVVALFGAPLWHDDHALRALLTAVDMGDAHGRTMDEWRDRGWPQPGIGIGISTGEVAVGNMGTQSHMYYTALGYWMNLGARLCAAAEAGEILTIPQTHSQALTSLKSVSDRERVPHLRFSSKGVFRFKNVVEPVEVLSVTVVDSQPGSEIARW
ncbi:MAG: adenylate/guanylate cyclase domain-containing protein [bacterium]